MKRNIAQATVAGSMLLATLCSPMVASAEHKCENPRTTIDQRACAKAAEGPDSLRNFVSRTKTIWGLYYWDYARVDEPRSPAPAPIKLAVPGDTAPKAATATFEAR
jgi:hypothetical protein